MLFNFWDIGPIAEICILKKQLHTICYQLSVILNDTFVLIFFLVQNHYPLQI